MTWRPYFRIAAAVQAVLLGLVLAYFSWPAAQPNDLYASKSLVTGNDERYRNDAFKMALAPTLAKVSGDWRLIGDKRVEALNARAPEWVESFSYRDRMEGFKINDEQGTRDRPYEVTVRFKPDAIDKVLADFLRKPWAEGRPKLAVLLRVDNHGRRYVLTRESKDGADQRDALAEQAWGAGVEALLPSNDTIARSSLAPEDWIAEASLDPVPAARAVGAETALVGTLNIADGDKGWQTVWRLTEGGRLHRWSVRDVSYDEALRRGVRGAAQILSGNGEPE